MKKIIYLATLAVAIVVFLSCYGQPSSSESPSDYIPSLISSNNRDLEFQKIGNTVNQLIGLWYADNTETNSYSRLRFHENGTFQEDIYSELTGEKFATVEGAYRVDNNQLSFTLLNAEQYHFEFKLVVKLLKLRPLF
jgi:hypothetical protein